MVGNERMFGVCVFLGTLSTPLLAQVQLAGDGLRMRTDVLKREFDKGGLLHDLLLRYTQAFISQLALTAACNRAHNISERLSKWLLMCQDRAQSNELRLTQEFIATMLGTRRAGVSEAAVLLKDAGVITYNRGHVTITDRAGLEAETCGCYPMIKKEFYACIALTGTQCETKARTWLCQLAQAISEIKNPVGDHRIAHGVYSVHRSAANFKNGTGCSRD